MKLFKVFQLTRHEYNKTWEHLGVDENGEDIMEATLTYTGVKTVFYGKNKQELLNYNSIPEWRAEITGEFLAVAGHENTGINTCMFNGNPITLIN